jgi:hypothetical protein
MRHPDERMPVTRAAAMLTPTAIAETVFLGRLNLALDVAFETETPTVKVAHFATGFLQ